MAIIDGDGSANSLAGSLAADTITGAAGNDTIDGSQGIDIAVFSGNAADYRLGYSNGQITITDTNLADGDDGTDLLKGVEVLRFADRDYAAPPTGEFRVNTTTVNAQSRPASATLSDGSYVVVWESNLQDGSNYGVYGQVYDADGVAVGAEFQVNVYTTSRQSNATVTALEGGGFAVAWASTGQDGSAE